MYTLDGFLVPNAAHRYAIGSTHPPLVKARDGSVIVAYSTTGRRSGT
jgi:hypothetical protein